MYCRECGAKLLDGARFCNACGTPTKDQGAPIRSNDALSSPKKRSRSPWITLLLAFLCCGLPFVFQVVVYIFTIGNPLFSDAAMCVAGGVGACLGIVLMGGRRLLVPSVESFVLMLKKGWWAIAVSTALLTFEVVANAMLGEQIIEDGWLGRFVLIALMCVGIGLYEEGLFRGLLLHGMLDICGNDRRGLYCGVIISAVAFGMAHIDVTALSISDPLTFVQAFLKAVQTGVYAFFLAGLVLSSKSIMGAAFLHGFDDFLLMVPSMVLLSGSTDVQYVSTGDEAVETIVLYLVIIALYIPLAVIGKRMLDKVPVPERGAFHKE